MYNTDIFFIQQMQKSYQDTRFLKTAWDNKVGSTSRMGHIDLFDIFLYPSLDLRHTTHAEVILIHKLTQFTDGTLWHGRTVRNG